MLIDIIAGAGPSLMKVAPFIRSCEARAAADGPLRFRVVQSGGERSSSLLCSHSRFGRTVATERPALRMVAAPESLLASPASSQA